MAEPTQAACLVKAMVDVVSDEQVSEIIQLRSTGLSYRKIGEHYGIGISQVSRIVKGEQRGN